MSVSNKSLNFDGCVKRSDQLSKMSDRSGGKYLYSISGAVLGVGSIPDYSAIQVASPSCKAVWFLPGRFLESDARQ
jgi:hypothetical protein